VKEVHRKLQKPIDKLGERGAWAYSGTALSFFKVICTPYYLGNGQRYELQCGRYIHMQDPSEQKPIKNFGEKGACAYPGTAQSFKVPYIISGTGKATNFKINPSVRLRLTHADFVTQRIKLRS